LAPQGFSQELASLPGPYAPPGGELFLAKRGDHVLGCIAMAPLAPRIAEIRRLFVRPQARGIGVGKALVAAVLKAAGACGHREIRLEMLPGMEGAAALCKSFGFAPVASTAGHPRAGQITLGLKLAAK
jgi:GNAT superfamily N-acetyltransferase